MNLTTEGRYQKRKSQVLSMLSEASASVEVIVNFGEQLPVQMH